MSLAEPHAEFPCLACGYATDLSIVICPECGAPLNEQRAAVHAKRAEVLRRAERARNITLISITVAAVFIALSQFLYQPTGPLVFAVIIAGGVIVGASELSAFLVGVTSDRAEREVTVAAWRVHALWLVAPFLASSLSLPLLLLWMLDTRGARTRRMSAWVEQGASLVAFLIVGFAIVSMFRWAAVQNDTTTRCGLRTRRGSYAMILLGGGMTVLSLFVALAITLAAGIICRELRIRGTI